MVLDRPNLPRCLIIIFWGFNEDENGLKNEINDDEESSWGLWEAEKAIFVDNESARRALADMKLELISESEARELIRKRVEINA